MFNINENNVYFHFNKTRLINNFNSYSKIGKIYYPLKTNANKNVLCALKTFLNKEGNGFLISNIKHYEQLMEIGVNPNRMCLINVLSGKETVKYLYDEGIKYFVFDNIESLTDFSKYADFNKCKIAVRLNTMEVFNDKLMHLGANTNDCLKMFKSLKGKCNDYGISFYLQTSIKHEYMAFEKMLDYIVNKFNNIGLNFISIAGIKESNKINIEYLNKIKKVMNIKDIILEPGKYLVGNTIDMETKIIRIKPLKDKTIVILKNGLYSGFLDILLYNEKFKLYFKNANGKYIKLRYKRKNSKDIEILVCGGSSDSGDIIGTMYIDRKYKNELIVGKEIIVKGIGAYFEEFFMPYGGDINKVYVEEGYYEIQNV